MIIQKAKCSAESGKIKFEALESRPRQGQRDPTGFSIHKSFIGGMWKFEETFKENNNEITLFMIVLLYKTGGTDPLLFEYREHRDQVYDFIDSHTNEEEYSQSDTLDIN